MDQINKLFLLDEAVVPLYDNPFQSSKINAIHIHFFKNTNQWTAHMEFANGNTEGKQKFNVSGVDGLPKLLSQMDKFIKSL